MLTYPYEIIKRRLTLDVPELREIDWYLQQDSTSDKNTWLFAAPALFIEITPGEFQSLGSRVQSMEAEITIHLLTESVLDSGKRMKKDQPIDHMRIFDKVYNSLYGFSSKLSYLPEFVALLNTSQDQRVMNSITRVGIVSPHVIRKTMMKSEQQFRCLMYDHAASKKFTKQTFPLEVIADIDIPPTGEPPSTQRYFGPHFGPHFG